MNSESQKFTVTKSLALNQDKRGAIVGFKGYLEGKIIHLASDRIYVVGREPTRCHIVIKGKAVSREHFHIRYNSATEDYTIQDCSKNGTVVDGAYKLEYKVDTKLQSGRRLWIGDSDNELILG